MFCLKFHDTHVHTHTQKQKRVTHANSFNTKGPKDRLHESRLFFFEVFFCSRTCTYAGAETSPAGRFYENTSRSSMEFVRDFLERRINVITRRTSEDMRQSVEASSKKTTKTVYSCKCMCMCMCIGIGWLQLVGSIKL